MMKPGINFIPEIKNIMDNPLVKAQFDSGKMVLLDDEQGIEPQADYTKYSQKVLLKDIPKIYDVKILDHIKATDYRGAIQSAVDKQIAIVREGEPRVKMSKLDEEPKFV